MKFIGIHSGHDANITYSDDTNVRYIKVERNFQKKHHPGGIRTHNQVIDHLRDHLTLAKKLFNIDFSKIDAICIYDCFDWNGFLPLNKLYTEIKDTNNALWYNFKCPIYLIDHHYAHALSCWPLTDVVDKNTTHFVVDERGSCHRTAGIYRNNNLLDYEDVSSPSWSGTVRIHGADNLKIKGNDLDIPGKVMALKSYHNLSDDTVNDIMTTLKFFNYHHFNVALNIINKFESGDTPTRQTYINIAHLLHVFAEEKMPKWFEQYANVNDIVTYSGGTAQNIIINTALKNKFPNLVIPPHCPDDGISLGCVEFLRQYYDQPPFDTSNFPFWQSDEAPATVPSNDTVNQTAELLARGKIVGWYQGHGELGPRALGNRSILMNPTIKHGKDLINNKVKHREPYRPFGASILSENANQFFECDYESSYMLYNFKCRDADKFKSITHVDGTCRIQTVSQQPQHEHYYRLIDRFKQLTGIPMLLNTSLNVDGKPIAGYIENANELYNTTELDALVVGDNIKSKG